MNNKFITLLCVKINYNYKNFRNLNSKLLISYQMIITLKVQTIK